MFSFSWVGAIGEAKDPVGLLRAARCRRARSRPAQGRPFHSDCPHPRTETHSGKKRTPSTVMPIPYRKSWLMRRTENV